MSNNDKTPASKPPILTNVYGSNPPKAAQAGVGATTISEIREAVDARRNQRPGDYNNSRDKG
jgi:hypothetical protein